MQILSQFLRNRWIGNCFWSHGGRRVLFALFASPLIVALATLAGCRNDSVQEHYPDTLPRYDYRATRALVLFVRRAADAVREKGPQAFDLMRENPELWKTDDFYIYVYALDGDCLYHGGIPELEGRDIRDLADTNGKSLLDQMLQATEDPVNPDGWVHFVWALPNRFYEVEKSSCHYRVTMPDGRTVLVGGGLAEPPEEREFARCVVDSATRLIKQEGERSLDEIRRPNSRFRYRKTSVFVLASDGTALIDPGIHLSNPRNLKDFVDDVGHRPFSTAYERLKREDRIWSVVLTRSRYDRNLIKQTVYLRLAILNGQHVMVGAIVPVPKPVWVN